MSTDSSNIHIIRISGAYNKFADVPKSLTLITIVVFFFKFQLMVIIFL